MFGLRSRLRAHLFDRWGIPQSRDGDISKTAIKKIVPRSPVIVDCGAYDGADSIGLVKRLGGTVHAFEAVPDIYRRLVDRTSSFPGIVTYNCALGPESGNAGFHLSEGSSDASSSLRPPKTHLVDHPDTSFNRTIQVDVLSLDDWAEKYQIEKVDLLWLDMQGSELETLQASSRVLPSVTAVHSEVSVKETYEGVAQYPELRDWMVSAGFRVLIEQIPDGWDMGNVLFVRG